MINKIWLISIVEIKIRIITTLIIIRNIGTDKYIIFLYAIFIIYFPGKNINSFRIYIYITREIHIVKNLKIKIFIRINIFGLELIDIFVSKNNLYINLYEINIFIIIKTRSINSVRRIVYAKLELIIAPNSSIIISIYYINVPVDRDFLFKLFYSLYLSFYAYLVDYNIYYVLIKNKTSEFIQIPRNIKLNIIEEINFDNCYYIIENSATVSELIILYNTRPE